MAEPKRQTDLAGLWQPFREKVEAVLRDLKGHGLDPVVFEALRSQERQDYYWSIGRTIRLGTRPITWVRHSKHQDGLAADIISKKQGYQSGAFFAALRSSALAHGLRDYRGKTLFDGDRAHIQMGRMK